MRKVVDSLKMTDYMLFIPNSQNSHVLLLTYYLLLITYSVGVAGDVEDAGAAAGVGTGAGMRHAVGGVFEFR